VDNLLLKGIDLAEAEHWLQKYESDFSKSEREFIKSSQSSQRLSWRKVFILVICPWMPVGTLEAAKKLTLVGAVCSAVMSFCYLPNLASLSHLYMPILWAGLAIGTFWNSRVAAATAVGIGAAMALLIPLGDMQVGIVTPFHPDLLQAFLLSVNLSTIASTEVLLFLIQPGLWAGLRGATARHYLAVSKAMVD
jgi:hypothetical protein